MDTSKILQDKVVLVVDDEVDVTDTLEEVLDLTESRISQIHTKAVIKLRPKLKLYYDVE